MNYIRLAVIVLCLWRVVHSLPFYLAALTHSWVLPPWGTPDPTVLHALSQVSAIQLVLWTTYMTGYATTGVVLALRHSWSSTLAFWAAAAAVLSDMGYWIWVTSQPTYLAVETPSFTIEDALMNIASLLVLLGSGMLFFNERRTGM